jgi:hypothetical protein
MIVEGSRLLSAQSSLLVTVMRPFVPQTRWSPPKSPNDAPSKSPFKPQGMAALPREQAPKIVKTTCPQQNLTCSLTCPRSSGL